MRLSILGGSSPFTAALVDGIAAERDSFTDLTIVLHGRSHRNTHLLARYAESRLACEVVPTNDIEQALTGATVALNQIRFGGLELRRAGELLCEKHSLHSDETIGPAALLTAISTYKDLIDLKRSVATVNSECWLVNLTNPLSFSHRVLAGCTSRLVSLCELPEYTARRIAEYFSVRFEEMDWSYTGLNHRGFIHGVRHQGIDLLPQLVQDLAKNSTQFEGQDATTIADLNAVPLKYFQLYSSQPDNAGRALSLSDLRKRLYQQLESDISRTPPALAERYMAWYPYSVVPFLRSIQTSEPETQVINITAADGYCHEVKAEVSENGVLAIPQQPPPSAVSAWMDRFFQHEKAFIQAAADPCLDTVKQALFFDLTVPEFKLETVCGDLLALAEQHFLKEASHA